MHKELNLESANIFKIDSKDIIYNLKADQVDTNTGKIKVKNVMSCILLRNITESPIVVRVRTNKKENYAVNPTYFVLEPNGTKSVEIELYAREETVTAIKDHHKFCVEGIIIENQYIKNEPKSIFGIYQKNKKKVFGQTSKYRVNIIIESDDMLAQSTLNPQNVMYHDKLFTPERKDEDNHVEEGEIFKSSVMVPGELNNKLNQASLNNIRPLNEVLGESVPVNNINISNSNSEFNLAQSDLRFSNLNISSNNKDNLDALKINCHKLKEELENLTNTYENLKKRIEGEKDKMSNNIGAAYNEPKQPETKEKKVSNFVAMGICAFSVILGFYLTK